jgi:hypothetical protein
VVGAGITTSQTKLRDGKLIIEATVLGNAVRLGDFTGQFLVIVPNMGPPIVVEAVFRAKDRSTARLAITFTEAASGGGESGNNMVLHGTFAITGGTSPFAWPGGGTATMRVDTAGNGFTFVLKGQTAAAGPTVS